MIRRDSFTGSGNGTVGYVRRSTDKQEQSIEDQKNAISAYIAENGLRFLRFYIDNAVSGTSTLGRRAFRQMIRDAESSPRPFDIIAVYDIKRFGRIDNDEAGYYRYLLRTPVLRSAMSARTSMVIRPMTFCGRSNNGRPVRNPKTFRRSPFGGCFRSPAAASGWAEHRHMDMICGMKMPKANS
ncbi:MAG: recombinase family protein [Phycisphaerae bacterium]